MTLLIKSSRNYLGKNMKLYNVALALGLAGLGILQQANSAKALTWDWSYTSGTIAAGTFTTAGTTPQANTPYTITGIGGLRGGVAITGLSNSPTIFETPDKATILKRDTWQRKPLSLD